MTKTVIAELCQNHSGDTALISDMTHAAFESGADIIKMQYIRSESLTFRSRFETGLVEGGVQKVIRRPYADEFHRLSKLDIPDSAHSSFLDVCTRLGATPMVTVFTIEDISKVLDIGYTHIKLASFDCASTPLINLLATNARVDQLIVSTGCSFRSEIVAAANILKKKTNSAILHCISIYPTPLHEAHLSRLSFLKQLHPHVGISDHSNPEASGFVLSTASSLLGASYVEKHFTILPKDQTKDGPVSVNPDQLLQLSSLFRASAQSQEAYLHDMNVTLDYLQGDCHRELSRAELLNRDYYQGRFSSRTSDNSVRFNWEDEH